MNNYFKLRKKVEPAKVLLIVLFVAALVFFISRLLSYLVSNWFFERNFFDF